MSETIVPRNDDDSWTLYNQNGNIVTLTFPAQADFEVVIKDVPAGLPSGYTWLINFGIKNPGGNFLPSVTYNLEATDRTDGKSWFVYYGGSVRALKGTHTSPGDPPIGTG